MTYASSAWWGFTTASDRNRLQAFLKRSVKFGYRSASAPPLAAVCEQADSNLFNKIRTNSAHLLYALLPPVKEVHYDLRERPHSFQLLARTSGLRDCNFIFRVLY